MARHRSPLRRKERIKAIEKLLGETNGGFSQESDARHQAETLLPGPPRETPGLSWSRSRTLTSFTAWARSSGDIRSSSAAVINESAMRGR